MGAFEIYDKDKEGKIDCTTLGAVLRSLAFNPTEKELTEIFEACKSGDKCDEAGMLKAAEMAKGKMGGNEEAALLEAFTVFDKESNGFLPAAEIRHLLHNVKF